MKRNEKRNILKAVAIIVALALLTSVSATIETENESQSIIGIPITLTNIASLKAMKEKILPVQFTTSGQSLDVDFPVFSLDNDCQNPDITTDGLGNILVLTEEIVGSSETSIWGRWSVDSGGNWSNEYWGWPLPYVMERPKIDYKEGMTAWGTDTTDTAIAHYIDFPDITNPAVPSPTSPDGWTIWYVDWGSDGFSEFDSLDIACYPYTPGISPSTRFFGCVAITGDSPSGEQFEDNTAMLSFMEANDKMAIIFFYNINVDVKKISCDIDQSLAQYYWVSEYVSETDPTNNGSQFIKAPVFDGTDNWWQGFYPGFLFAGVYNPNMIATEGSVYIVGETAENDIVCLYSSNAGSSFESSNITDTIESESYPTVAVIGNKIICSYIRNGDLYVSVSNDGGQTWTETDQINDESGTVVDQYSSVNIDNLYAVWTDDRNNPTEIYFDTTTTPPPPPPLPILNITEIKGGLGISATIENTGDVDATDIEWSITVKGGIFGFIDEIFDGTISCIGVDEEFLVKTGIFFGFGQIAIEIEAICAEGSSDSKTETGMQIIIFTKI